MNKLEDKKAFLYSKRPSNKLQINDGISKNTT